MSKKILLKISREQLWVLHDILYINPASDRDVIVDTLPVNRKCAEDLLWALLWAEDNTKNEVEIELTKEDAFRLSISLKSHYRDASGQSIRPLILALIRAALSEEQSDSEVSLLDDPLNDPLKKWLSGD